MTQSSTRTLSAGLAAMLCLAAAGCARVDQREAKLEASAQSYVRQERYSEAIIQYRNAIKLKPNSAPLEYALGEVYTKNQQYQDAFAAFNKALSVQPAYEPAQLAVGEFYLVAKQYPKAAASAQLTLSQHPGDVSASILLANLDAAQGRAPAAIARLEALAQLHPESGPVRLTLGILYAVGGRHEDAQRQFQRAIALDPSSAMARNDLANLLSSQGDWKGAETVYRADVEQNRASVPARQALAAFLFARGRYTEAEPVYQSLVTLQNNSPQSQFALASFELAAGKPAAAEAIDQKLAREAPSFLAAREQWAQIAGQNQDYAQMNRVLDALLKDRPNDLNALLLRAGAQLNQRQPGPALETLAAAQRLNPNVARIAFETGEAYLQQSNFDRAQDSFTQAIGLDPRFIEAQAALAELTLDRGNSRAALGYAAQVQALAPRRPDGYLFAGNALANLRRLPEAATAFQHYAELAPGSSLGPSHLGYVYLMEKKLPDAESQFEQALRLNPSDTDALAGLVTSYQNAGQGAQALPRIQKQLALTEAAHAPASTLATIGNQLARAFVNQKRIPEAEASLRASLTKDPHNYNTYVLLGTLYAQENAFGPAQAQFTQAVAVNPNSAGLWTLLGMLDEQMQNPTAAEQAYTHAVAIDPNNGVADNNLAALYANRPGSLDQALVLAQRAKRALPNVADVSDTLGWIYTSQNLYQMAIPLLQQAVKGQPGSSGFRVHLATALFRDGRKPEAYAELHEAIRLDGSLKQRPDIQRMLNN